MDKIKELKPVIKMCTCNHCSKSSDWAFNADDLHKKIVEIQCLECFQMFFVPIYVDDLIKYAIINKRKYVCTNTGDPIFKNYITLRPGFYIQGGSE